MNKAELIEAVVKEMDCTKADAARGVNAVLNGIKKGLKKDKKVSLVGFGNFDVSKRKARKGRNPQTGEVITIKASKTVGFKAGKALKNSI